MKKSAAQLQREVDEALAQSSRLETAREIRAATGAGMHVYIVDRDGRRFRVTDARTTHGTLHVRILATGSWVPVYAPEYVESSSNGESHATKRNRGERRILLEWSDPQSPYPSLRHTAGRYPETTVHTILESLFERGIPEVKVKGRNFKLSSYDDVWNASAHAQSTSQRGRSHSTIKTYDASKPDLSVRQINAIVRAADGRNIYLIRTRLGDETIQRITSARTKGRETEVRSLMTGNWIPVLPERGDRLEVR